LVKEDEVAVPERIGAVAAQLGVVVVSTLGMGDDGTAYRLSDGRVLRATSSLQEVAIALALKDCADNGLDHPGFPKIHGVWWFKDTLEMNGVEYPYISRVLIRDEVPNIGEASVFAGEPAVWRNALDCFGYGWAEAKQEYVDFALGKEPALQNTLDALVWASEALGVKVLDIRRPSNFGIVDGRVGIRDFSRAIVPAAMLLRVEQSAFEQLQLPAPKANGHAALTL
jgi:hypothetical protein